MDVKDKSRLTTFEQKQVKKWNQNVSRSKIFLHLQSNLRN